MSGALEGIRVLDLTQGVAGPYATKLFSDYGADVIKVERPDGGDVARRMGPFPNDEPNSEASGMFLELNTGKRSVTLDLKSASGQDILCRLIANTDLVVESFMPGTLERLGVTSETIREANPLASLVQISNFGQTGPYRDMRGDDLLLYAMGGVLAVTATEGREPVRIGLYAPLFLAGGVIAAFTLGAFFGARTAGKGERVDISIHDILTASMDRGGTNLAAYEYTGSLFFERGRVMRGSALPNGVYPCADGYVHITTGPNWWPRFCRAIDRPELIEDERLLGNLLNVDFAAEIDALVYPWLLERTKQQVMERAQAEGWVVSAINDMADVANDPHLHARGFWQSVENPVVGAVTIPGFPFRMLGTPGELRRAPTLGEHNTEVLSGLGFSTDDITRLRQRGVI
jgi:crotonobetainyl-CoA:carnitine CoA-transferase CaiB-like acyl-CoA transferase